jgi:hypothetical protein
MRHIHAPPQVATIEAFGKASERGEVCRESPVARSCPPRACDERHNRSIVTRVHAPRQVIELADYLAQFVAEPAEAEAARL